MFQSYQSRQIKPDKWNTVEFLVNWYVSIVSIQTDQSRPQGKEKLYEVVFRFQSYQFRQINPDLNEYDLADPSQMSFQSYQSRQINPDAVGALMFGLDIQGFQSYQSKQINPDPSKPNVEKYLNGLVSIVSIQTDQSRPQEKQNENPWNLCFNRINSDRSIPTFIP